MTKAIVLGGSRGIGKAISNSLKSIEIDVFAASKNDIDTANLNSVKKFLDIHNEADILILNTGGPKPKPFSDITKDIVVSSAINIIEIWDKQKYEQAIDDATVDFADLAEDVMGQDDDNNGLS